MLQKRIDLGSQPFGLAVAGEDIVKGSLVVVKYEGGEVKAYLPATADEAAEVKGFATFRIETAQGADKDHDVIKKGSRLVIYTLVKDNMWGTTQFSGDLAVGAVVGVGHTGADKGKLVVGGVGSFTVHGASGAGEGYSDAMVDVIVG